MRSLALGTMHSLTLAVAARLPVARLAVVKVEDVFEVPVGPFCECRVRRLGDQINDRR